MGAGLILMGAGDLWTAAVPVPTQVGLGPVIAPYVLIGIGFALAVSAMTAVLVDTVPIHLEGMASAAANMLRDFGFTLGPAVVGAVALSRAAADIHTRVTSDPALSRALAAFNSAAAHATGAKAAVLKPAAGAVNSGPLGANAVPDPPNPIKQVAFHALGSANSVGYVVCGIAGLVAAVLVITALGGRPGDDRIDQESLVTSP
jgi:hypothetical protein